MLKNQTRHTLQCMVLDMGKHPKDMAKEQLARIKEDDGAWECPDLAELRVLEDRIADSARNYLTDIKIKSVEHELWAAVEKVRGSSIEMARAILEYESEVRNLVRRGRLYFSSEVEQKWVMDARNPLMLFCGRCYQRLYSPN